MEHLLIVGGLIILFICVLGSVCRAYDKYPNVWIIKQTLKNGIEFFEVRYKSGLICSEQRSSSSRTEAHARQVSENCRDYLVRIKSCSTVKKEILDV